MTPPECCGFFFGAASFFTAFPPVDLRAVCFVRAMTRVWRETDVSVGANDYSEGEGVKNKREVREASSFSADCSFALQTYWKQCGTFQIMMTFHPEIAIKASFSSSMHFLHV